MILLLVALSLLLTVAPIPDEPVVVPATHACGFEPCFHPWDLPCYTPLRYIWNKYTGLCY